MCTFGSFCPQLIVHWAAAHSQCGFRWTGQMSNGPDTQTYQTQSMVTQIKIVSAVGPSVEKCIHLSKNTGVPTFYDLFLPPLCKIL